MKLRHIIMAATMMAAPAVASTFAPVTTACPVGGKRFTYQGYASYSTFGGLPDGQPIGSAQFPIEIPQCPDNGLVLYRDFDKATIARLTPIVLGPEYQALRKGETRYYLAQWLETKLGGAEPQIAPLLLAATWEAKNGADPAQASRYNAEFVKRATALPDDPATLRSLALKARAANALREMGRFEEAETLRASLTVLPTMGAKDEDGAESREGWTTYLAQLRPVIARRDPSRAPIDLIGEREAQVRCVAPEEKDYDGPPLTDFERAYCARPELREGLQSLREAWGLPAIKPG